jgi:hypothetical protein
MKKILAISLTILVLMLCIFAVASCKKDSDGDGDMLYTSDTSLGTGETTFTLIVEHSTGEKINFTISTSEAILSNALTGVGILQGHDSTYGLYIDSVNGITHDFNTDGYYWAIYEGEEYAQTGIDGITIVNGATYKLVASK